MNPNNINYLKRRRDEGKKLHAAVLTSIEKNYIEIIERLTKQYEELQKLNKLLTKQHEHSIKIYEHKINSLTEIIELLKKHMKL